MKSLKYILATIAATSVLTLTTVVHADENSSSRPHHGFHEHGDHERGEHHPRFDKILDLTDAQKKTLKDARTAQEPAQHELHEKLQAAREALAKAGDTNADDATLTKLSTDFGTLVAQGEVARIKFHRQLISILTPDQKQKLADWESEHKPPMPPRK
jgi:Spy/CpxP family protein refolding chaperone